jgi:hypothetical protein
VVGISWTRERSAAVSAAGEGSDEIGVCRGPRVVGMESKASVLGTPRRCTLDSSDSCERRAACAARSVASRWAAALSITGWPLVLGFLPPPPSPGWLGASDAANRGEQIVDRHQGPTGWPCVGRTSGRGGKLCGGEMLTSEPHTHAMSNENKFPLKKRLKG